MSSETGSDRVTDLPPTASRNVSAPQPNGLSGAEIPHSHGSTHPGASTPKNVPVAVRPPSNAILAVPLNTPVLALKLNAKPGVRSSVSVFAPARTASSGKTDTAPYRSLAAADVASNASANGAPGS